MEDYREVKDEDKKELSAGTDNQAEEKKEDEYEQICFVCRRPESKAGRMYKLPNNICVCEDCMHRTMDAVSQFDYNGLLNNPELLNQLNKQGNPFFNIFGGDGAAGIPNSQRIKKKKENQEKPVFDIKIMPTHEGIHAWDVDDKK